MMTSRAWENLRNLHFMSRPRAGFSLDSSMSVATHCAAISWFPGFLLEYAAKHRREVDIESFGQ
jgi:hypothetical protein